MLTKVDSQKQKAHPKNHHRREIKTPQIKCFLTYKNPASQKALKVIRASPKKSLCTLSLLRKIKTKTTSHSQTLLILALLATITRRSKKKPFKIRL